MFADLGYSMSDGRLIEGRVAGLIPGSLFALFLAQFLAQGGELLD